ncbi:PAS domain-containing protein [Dyadobacter chenwenxiniae]|uniref:histidine kinase n=1 Tax=Dyadobacter chenwenxiniae TaxID=2906456 RepID=A0A9X1PJR6_9BACT|nr:PAS domain-containing protein [Dyadobacter chenwenxiniae]MCF0062355.1 PAS domain-containing protein [Dyadobacter chenwenxiniae]UON83890.1 PAS domain-containing protein [Dyadobacter chenwenxiniae]
MFQIVNRTRSWILIEMIETLDNSNKDNLLVAIERFELVVKATHDVIWDWDLEKNTVWWNDGMKEVFGYTSQEVEPGPESWFNRIHPDDRTEVVHNMHAAIDRGDSNWGDYYRFQRADGSFAYVHDRGYTIRADGKAVRMVGCMRDLSEIVQSDEARQESEDNLQFALSAAQLGVWNMNPETGVVYFDERCRGLYGNPSEEILNYETLIQHIHFEDREKVVNAISSALNPETRTAYDIRYRTVGASDHVLRWLHCTGKAYFTPEGVPYRFSGVSRNVTDEISSKERVAWADQQAAMTVEGSGAGSFLVALDTNEIIYSPTMSRIITGRENGDMKRDFFVMHIHPEDFDKRTAAYEIASKTGELRYEARFVWHDDSVHWVKVIGQYLYDSTGKAISLSGIVMDITDRIESENMIKASEEHLRTLIEQAPVATCMFVGKDMVIELPNEAMLKIWGKGDSVIGKPLREALPPEMLDQQLLNILDHIFETGKPYSASGRQADLIVNGTLETFYFDFTYKPLRNSKGEIYAILDMAVDVTEQVKSRQALERSEERYRLLVDELEQRVQKRTEELHQANQELVNSNSNLQQFAYAASHDMQEPLRKIQSFSSRLQTVYSESFDENGVFMLNRIQDASKRMSSMIDDLLAYSRLTTHDSAFEAVDLNKIVSAVIADLEVSIEEQKSEIRVAQLPVVWGNPSQLTQLVQNLLSNAIKYKKQDIPSEIEIRADDLTETEKADLPRLSPGHRYIKFEVSDNGIGFDEKYLGRIFQMFQRLHGRGEFSGSGIGLALCKKVVQNHHGHITAQSEPDRGATFMVYLPIPN